MNRRQLLLGSLATAASAAAAVGLYTWRLEPHWVEFVRRPLPIVNLPRDVAGRTLVQLSDLHIGRQVDSDYVIRTFERVRALRPDYVVFTGDFVTYNADSFDELREVMRHFPHGRLRTITILGNHDYGPSWAHPEIASQIASIATTAGVHVLRNTAVVHDGLHIVGLDDLWARQFRLMDAFTGIDRTAATLALSHNPDTADMIGWNMHRGWILSGHTHGGQCKAPFLPPPMLPVKNRTYTSGEFALPGARRLYINRGIGHLLRARFNVRPEVTVFQLERA